MPARHTDFSGRPPGPKPALVRAASICAALGLLVAINAVRVAAQQDPTEAEEAAASLPTDRQQERRLDLAARLLGDARWSDAVTVLDEILAADRDAFFKPRQPRDEAEGGTWRSVKTEAARLIATLPPAGREAYGLQFRARAERMLAEAIAAADPAAIVTVARRWFATPPGQRAALLAAIEALEADQPLAAIAWLARLDAGDAGVEPTLAVMRAMAYDAAGDAASAAAILDRARFASRGTMRVGGRDVAVPHPADRGLEWVRSLAAPAGRPPAGAAEWRQPRGDASRNALAVASRPLLVPRYRVPIVRHPEEARRLDALRRERADEGDVAFPAATPLAVDGTIVLRTPLGLLAVDFATGKRLWLQPGPRIPAADPAGREPLVRSFEDFNNAAASSDGRRVFVVDSHPEAITATTTFPAGRRAGQREPAWQGGNTLSAYDLAAGGRLVWRLPAPGDSAAAGRPAVLPPGSLASTTWFAGAPLVVGDRLLVIAEENAEARLEILAAADGRRIWMQPLAHVDEARAITGPQGAGRRLGGAMPALGDGVVVCPLNVGMVVAVDLANRALLWAHAYGRGLPEAGEPAGNPLGRRGLPAAGGRPRAGWCDDGPVVAAGRVLLSPEDAEELLCLDLRDGRVVWKLPRGGRLQVAGVVAGRVVVVGKDAVESLELDTGHRVWRLAFQAGVCPSGRGILTADRLFLPLDSAEVVEVVLADGTIAGRSLARGGAVPGNLVAYRGEVIALGAETLDVFHQAAALETRIETAAGGDAAPAWQAVWRSHLALDRGHVQDALRQLRDALAGGDARQPPETLSAALAFALERDFAAALPLWRDCLPATGITSASRTALRAVVDGALATGAVAEAWAAWRELLARSPGGEQSTVADHSDPLCAVADGRWLRGRLERIQRQSEPPLREEITAALERELGNAGRVADPAARVRALADLAEVAGASVVGMAAREQLLMAFAARRDETTADEDATRVLRTRREFLLVELSRSADARQREAARAALATIRGQVAPAADAGEREATAQAWPLGQVEVRGLANAGRSGRGLETWSRLVPIATEETAASLLPGLAIAWDSQQARLLFSDRYGRRQGEPVTISETARPGIPVFDQGSLGAAVLGRVAFVRSSAGVMAVDLGGRGSAHLWTRFAAGDPAAGGGRLRRLPPPAMRLGGVPLGMRVAEPGGAASTMWGRPSTAGLPVMTGRALAILDPATGRLLWERHRLPAAAELFNDDEFVCIAPADGRPAPVLAMADGRWLHEIPLPDRQQRLLSCGRHLLAIAGFGGASDGGVAERVRLEVLDVADRSRTPVGEYPGAARACVFAPGMVALVAPDGGFTVIDVATRRVSVRGRLPAMPATLDLVEVLPWEDRLLICAGRRVEAGPDGEPHGISPLQQMLIAGAAIEPMDFHVWSVDAASGDPLWQAPAKVAGQCLLAGQPAGLPVLVFARQIQRHHDRESSSLGVLCLDKRTGHAVLDETLAARKQPLFGCDVSGDPEQGTITVWQRGGDARRLTLEFTGAPGPPRAPHQGGSPVRPDAGLGGLGRWLERALRPVREP